MSEVGTIWTLASIAYVTTFKTHDLPEFDRVKLNNPVAKFIFFKTVRLDWSALIDENIKFDNWGAKKIWGGHSSLDIET